jgi:signal transduction histidine kinase
MEKLRHHLAVSFRTKVLVPVITVMVLMLALTVWVLDQRITAQFKADGRSDLATADAVFRSVLKLRSRNLLLRFRNLPNEPRYKATLQSGDGRTIRNLLRDLLAEQGVDIVVFRPNDSNSISPDESLFQKRDPLISAGEFEEASDVAVVQALAGEESADTVRVGDRLYDVISIPVLGVGDAQVGALTFGSEIGSAVAQDLSLLTRSEIALLINGRVIASTLHSSEDEGQLQGLTRELSRKSNTRDDTRPVTKAVLGGEHFFCSAGRFESLRNDDKLGYLLLTSYEQPLRSLEATRQLLLGASIAAILLGAAVVWFLVRKVTEPLRELRDSAEAVGRGDFSRRVEARSQDECGELALVFNRMTENLKSSREQLELTVDSLKNTQAQLVQSEKLAGIGEFVSGVAHELNNPLTSVMGFSELLCQFEVDPKQKHYLEMVNKSANRCQKIVQALLSFARRHQPERKPVSVNTLLEATLEILNYQLRTSNIELQAHFDPDLPLALVDPHQIQQVFLNMINNARQAIEAHQPSGWIRITTKTRGPNVRIIIQDSGPGIKPEHVSKIFDPFFTTKEIGKGTGLGLSLCYGIVKEHGGSIEPRSRPGEGATFVIELPITHEAAGPEPGQKRAPDTDVINPHEGGGKKVLIIDDEEPILQMVRETLTRHGYKVDTASDGEAGLRRLRQNRYDLLLCDWKMPGLNGQQVFERLRSRNRDMADRVIFITGDVVNDRVQHFLEAHKKVCLPKPFTLAEFREAIAKVLSAQ